MTRAGARPARHPHLAAGRVTARHPAAARHLGRGGPEGQSARLPINHEVYRAQRPKGAERTAAAPGARRAATTLLSRAVPARRVTGATPEGRPGPRAPQPQATSLRGPDSVKPAGPRGVRPSPAIARHAGQRTAWVVRSEARQPHGACPPTRRSLDALGRAALRRRRPIGTACADNRGQGTQARGRAAAPSNAVAYVGRTTSPRSLQEAPWPD
jgi:hypothetical protein